MVQQVQSFFSGSGLQSVGLVAGGLYRKSGWMENWPFNVAEVPSASSMAFELRSSMLVQVHTTLPVYLAIINMTSKVKYFCTIGSPGAPMGSISKLMLPIYNRGRGHITKHILRVALVNVASHQNHS